MTLFDDGNGPALYAGGRFLTIGDQLVSYVAKWDDADARWTSLGLGVNGRVYTLKVYDDGSGPALYAGGSFTTAGGNSAFRVAKWDGTSWSPVSSGMNGPVYALEEFDDGNGSALYAAGSFSTVDGVSMINIAKWNGFSWSPLDTGADNTVFALAVHDDGSGAALYATGHFTTAGSVTANRIAKWDGTVWASLGSGLNSGGHALVEYDDGSGTALYVGGDFTTAGSVTAQLVAKWDGSTWSAVGTGSSAGHIYTLEVHDDGNGPALYAGGSFWVINGVLANNLARWDGSVWTPLGAGTNETAFTLVSDGTTLHAAGDFTAAGGVAANRIASWDGTNWAELGTLAGHGFSADVRALTEHDDGTGPALYAGGYFRMAGRTPADRVARWNGSSWKPLGSGMDNTVLALTEHDDGSGPALYAGGAFQAVDGLPIQRIARWDGQTWAALGAGPPNDTVRALAVYDDGRGEALYAGGSFTIVNGIPANRIARWNGAIWESLGDGVSGTVYALTVYDDGNGESLYAAGAFETAGAGAASNIAKWDGSAWSPVGSGVDNTVLALAVHDDCEGSALYATGYFSTAGGVAARHIARWDGSNWSPLGSGLYGKPGIDLLSYNVNGVSALYVGGDFTSVGGVVASKIAMWDGTTWTSLGLGTNNPVRALALHDDGSGNALYAGGDFLFAGGIPSSRIGRWPCLPTAPTCPDLPDFSITKDNGQSQVVAGESLTYTLVAANESGVDGSARVEDDFPSTLVCSWTSSAASGATGNSSGTGPRLDDDLILPAGSSVTYTVDCQLSGAADGTLTNTATITAANDRDLSNNTYTDADPIVPVDPSGPVRTLILTNVSRMQAHMGPFDVIALLDKLHELALHPSVEGLVVNLDGDPVLDALYAAWDADVAAAQNTGSQPEPDLANDVLFAAGGVQDVLLGLLDTHPDAAYLVLVGDDRILPMARLRDFTSDYPEREYTRGLTPGLDPLNTTVGQAIGRNRYLSDDPLTIGRPIEPDELG